MERDIFVLPKKKEESKYRVVYYDELTTPIVNPLTAGQSSRSLRKPHDRICDKIVTLFNIRYHVNDISDIKYECQKQK